MCIRDRRPPAPPEPRAVGPHGCEHLPEAGLDIYGEVARVQQAARVLQARLLVDEKVGQALAASPLPVKGPRRNVLATQVAVLDV
eukprot:8224460-Alexandrium_andersonii.AAC.1